jgi:hypothetical protein
VRRVPNQDSAPASLASLASPLRTSDWDRPNCRAICDGLTPALKAARTALARWQDYEQHVRWAEYRKMMQALELATPSHQSELDLPQADDIRINDVGPVM